MKLYIRKYLSGIFLLVLLFTSCIKEDLSDCPTGMKLYFTYEPATYARTGINESEVERIDLFVFDAEGVLQAVYTDESPTLSPEYYMRVDDLPSGDYTFVVWCGVPTYYKIGPQEMRIGQTRLNEAMLYLDYEDEVLNGVQPIFHAHVSEHVGNKRDQIISLPLVQVYNTVNLTTEGLSPNDDTYRMRIYDNNGTYKFDYTFAECGDLIYTAQCDKDSSGQLSASLNVLKLADGRDPIFEITNVTRGTTLYRANLVTLINEITTTDYDTVHVYDIHLKFGLDVSVSINGWWVVRDGEIGLN